MYCITYNDHSSGRPMIRRITKKKKGHSNRNNYQKYDTCKLMLAPNQYPPTYRKENYLVNKNLSMHSSILWYAIPPDMDIS